MLTPDEGSQVREAERQANLATCLRGTSPTFCKHGMLTPDEAQAVRETETRLRR